MKIKVVRISLEPGTRWFVIQAATTEALSSLVSVLRGH